MNRTGLLAALAIAIVTGLVFVLFPELDLAISRLFFRAGTGFALNSHALLNVLRDGAMIVVAVILGVPVGALVAKLVRPRSRMAVPGRAVVYLITTIVLAPLLTANVLFKDNWARPRPRDVAAFGGTESFVPWWDPRGTCKENCSFVAGEAAGAFWTLAPASLAPAPWRPLAYAAAIVFGAAIGTLRMAFGGHFFSDVVFAGVFTFLIIWIVHALLYRWAPAGLSDRTIERLIESVGQAIRKPFVGRSMRPDRPEPERR
jgi:membrane-associated PAP2 superfamily phosphatase